MKDATLKLTVVFCFFLIYSHYPHSQPAHWPLMNPCQLKAGNTGTCAAPARIRCSFTSSRVPKPGSGRWRPAGTLLEERRRTSHQPGATPAPASNVHEAPRACRLRTLTTAVRKTFFHQRAAALVRLFGGTSECRRGCVVL